MSEVESKLLFNIFVIAIFVGIIASEISEKKKIPKIVPLIFTGMLLGFLVKSIFPELDFNNYNSQFLIFVELTLILVLFFESTHLDLRKFRKYLLPILLLAIVGTLVTAVLIGIILNATASLFPQIGVISLLVALLIGAIVVPTDPAATLAIFKGLGVEIKEKIQITMIGESAINDIIAILLVVTLLVPQVINGNTTRLPWNHPQHPG